MQTVLKGVNREVTISTAGQVVVIGECINPTRRKKLFSALQSDDLTYVGELAKAQIDRGAEVLDVNVGFPGVDDVKLLPEVVIYLQDNFDIPLCLDSPNPDAIRAALKVVKGKCLINSVNGETKSMSVLLPLAAETGSAVIGLLMDNNGIAYDPVKRVEIAEKLLEEAVKAQISPENLIIDPMAMAVSADPSACLVTLETIRLVNTKLGLNQTIGASNISFGLPEREYLNSAFLSIAIQAGVTCPIANPEKIIIAVRATDLILGRDDFAVRFIAASTNAGLNMKETPKQ